MALNHSPKIVTDGLVFYYDMNNTKKSNIGDTTTNLITNGDFSSGLTSWSNYSISPTVVTVYDFPTALGQPKQVAQCITLAALSGGGNYGGISRSVPVLTTGTTYTLSAYVRSASGPMRISFSNQNGSGDENNLSFTNYNIGSNWTRVQRTATLNLQKNTLYIWNQTIANGVFQLGDVQLEAKSTATTFTSSTRSNTQSIIDLTSVNTCTVSSLTFVDSQNFIFNGVNNYIDLGTTIQLTNNFSLSVWHKNPNTGYIIDQGNIDNDPTGCLEWTNYGLSLNANNLAGGATASASLNTSNWNNVVCTFASSVTNFYVNGEFIQTINTAFSSFSPQGQILKIGRRAFNTSSIFSGTIGNVQIYNKVLSANEVRQNFNSLRGRYGI